ncbi:MAG: chemotaxis-specific protein-glutamate methyltransferase CheB [Myxococcota bacterium]
MRALIVEDSSLYRKLLTDVLGELPQVCCADLAQTGHIALLKASSLRPELILLDMELPDMSGLEVIQRLRAEGNTASVVVVSGHTRRSDSRGAKALALGASEVICKPASGSASESRDELVRQLRPIVAQLAALAPSHDGCYPAPQIALRMPGLANETMRNSRRPERSSARPSSMRPPHTSLFPPTAQPATKPPQIVAIGASTGGPEALLKLLEALPTNFPVPIVMAVHTKAGFSATLAGLLDRRSPLRVVEAANGQTLEPGVAYLAPGGMQTRVERAVSGVPTIRVCDDAPENFCKPSVDYLFRAVGKTYRDRALYVILTGMGGDGTQGLIAARRYDCRVIAQDEASCVVFGMPAEAIRANVVDVVAPLDSIVEHMSKMVGR